MRTYGVSARLELRLRPESKRRIERAAALVDAPVSEFVRTAAEDRAEQVMAENEAYTHVPAAFFDELLAVLDVESAPSDALRRAGSRLA